MAGKEAAATVGFLDTSTYIGTIVGVEVPAVKERRQHVVYITKNSEYHCRRKECVAVRDRNTGRWRRWHAALRGQLLGSIAYQHGVVKQLQDRASGDVEVRARVHAETERSRRFAMGLVFGRHLTARPNAAQRPQTRKTVKPPLIRYQW